MTRPTHLRFAPWFLGLALPLAGAAFVHADDAPPPHGRPPQAAFDACQQKKPGDPCQVTFHEHTMSGICQSGPDDDVFCRPDHPPGPPPELKAACAEKRAGDACEATLHDHAVSGTCQEGHHDDGLICHPAAQPRP